MMKKLMIVGAAALSFVPFGAGPAFAQPTDEMIEKLDQMLAEADANGDGNVTRRELDDHRASVFARLDRNEDRVVDAQDRPRLRMLQRKYDSAFQQVAAISDKDRDGRITWDEWNSPDRDVFALLDENEDGVIQQSEIPRPE